MSKKEEEVKGPLKLFRFICFICFEWKGFLCSTALQDVLRLDFTMDDYALKGALEDDAIIDRVLDTEKVFSSCQI